MASVERPRQDAVGDRSANEQDPELGQQQRSKRLASRSYHGRNGEANCTASSDDGSSSSENSNNNGSDDAGSSSGRRGDTTDACLHPRGEDNRDATRWRSGRGQPDTSFSESGGSRFKDSGSPATGQGFQEEARRSNRSRRHVRRRKGKAGTREFESVHRHRALTTITTGVLTGLSRQAVGNAVRTTVRAVLSGWKGMTTAALRAVRKWQVREGLSTV